MRGAASVNRKFHHGGAEGMEKKIIIISIR
jgi:hypothetical protein